MRRRAYVHAASSTQAGRTVRSQNSSSPRSASTNGTDTTAFAEPAAWPAHHRVQHRPEQTDGPRAQGQRPQPQRVAAEAVLAVLLRHQLAARQHPRPGPQHRARHLVDGVGALRVRPLLRGRRQPQRRSRDLLDTGVQIRQVRGPRRTPPPQQLHRWLAAPLLKQSRLQPSPTGPAELPQQQR